MLQLIWPSLRSCLGKPCAPVGAQVNRGDISRSTGGPGCGAVFVGAIGIVHVAECALHAAAEAACIQTQPLAPPRSIGSSFSDQQQLAAEAGSAPSLLLPRTADQGPSPHPLSGPSTAQGATTGLHTLCGQI